MTVYNVKTDFGAVGDGVTDDMTAFVNAGAAMYTDPGSDLVVPAGTYLFNSNPTISGRSGQYWAKGVTGRILGAGIGTTTLNLNGRSLGVGAIGVYHDGNHFTPIQTVNAGATQVEALELSKTVTISAASPGVVTLTGHDWDADEPVVFFNTGGSLPAAITAGTIYYIKTVLSANTFTISATRGGASINTASTGTGTHSVSIFTPGRWVLVCGLNQQDIYSDVPNTGYGYPPNFAFIEFAQITAVDSTGLTTLSAPLQKSYKSTWPHINDGNAFETTAAGEAGLHLVDEDWGADIEVHDLTVTSNGNQLYAGCHSALFKNVDFPSSSAVIPSTNKIFTFDNVTTVVETEVDKLVEQFYVLNSNIYRLSSQSATMNEYVIDNSNIGWTAELTATATTSIGNNTITIGGGVPSWLTNGTGLLYTSVLGQFGSVSVSSSTGTTITLSGNAVKTVNIGDKFYFIRGGLNGAGIKTTITNSVLASCQPGAYAYGVCPDPFTITNTEVWRWPGAGGFTAAAEQIGTMTNGVIQLPNGTSTYNVVDNGSGKARYTVGTTAGLTAGKYIASGNTYQELVATATTSVGSPTITVASVPSWIVAGQPLSYHTGSNKFPSGTTVLSKTATTITFSQNATNAVSIGNVFGFRAAALVGDIFTIPPGHQILSVIDGTTVDLDQNFPSGFVYAGGGDLGFGGAFGWARPNTYLYYRGTLGEEGKFKVLDVTQDAHSTYVHTDQSGGWPTLPKAASGLSIQTPGAQSIRASGLISPAVTVVANDSLNDAQAYNKPLQSFTKFSFTGSDSATPSQKAGTKVVGNLVSIVIDVTQAYTGALFANLYVQLSQFPNLKFVVDGVSADLGWGVNVKQVGRRVILPTNTVTNPTQLSGDSNLIVPAWSDHIWMVATPTASFQTSAGTSGTLRDISGEASNLWPIVNIEITTDQGFFFNPTAVVPLRLRLRG